MTLYKLPFFAAFFSTLFLPNEANVAKQKKVLPVLLNRKGKVAKRKSPPTLVIVSHNSLHDITSTVPFVIRKFEGRHFLLLFSCTFVYSHKISFSDSIKFLSMLLCRHACRTRLISDSDLKKKTNINKVAVCNLFYFCSYSANISRSISLLEKLFTLSESITLEKLKAQFYINILYKLPYNIYFSYSIDLVN